MEYIFALILSTIFTIVYIYFRKKNTNSFFKPKALKKEELIENYKLELLDILEKCENNKELELQERLKFLKRVNYELCWN